MRPPFTLVGLQGTQKYLMRSLPSFSFRSPSLRTVPTGDELGLEIRRLRDEKQSLQNEQASRQDLKKRIDELMRFLNDLPCELIDYEEDYVRTLLEKITVYDDHIIVEFKSGIEIQIDE